MYEVVASLMAVATFAIFVIFSRYLVSAFVAAGRRSSLARILIPPVRRAGPAVQGVQAAVALLVFQGGFLILLTAGQRPFESVASRTIGDAEILLALAWTVLLGVAALRVPRRGAAE